MELLPTRKKRAYAAHDLSKYLTASDDGINDKIEIIVYKGADTMALDISKSSLPKLYTPEEATKIYQKVLAKKEALKDDPKLKEEIEAKIAEINKQIKLKEDILKKQQAI